MSNYRFHTLEDLETEIQSKYSCDVSNTDVHDLVDLKDLLESLIEIKESSDNDEYY